ncbi:MAG TPA: hypothetical protein VHV32_09755 [Candidatus Angelobacter sp.]|nr:hypothetical protein [Candidatus Angelobacter sp.]
MHDSSSAVGVKFVSNGPGWKKNERLGCVILMGAFPPSRRAIGEGQQTPSAVPVALQKEKVEMQEK